MIGQRLAIKVNRESLPCMLLSTILFRHCSGPAPISRIQSGGSRSAILISSAVSNSLMMPFRQMGQRVIVSNFRYLPNMPSPAGTVSTKVFGTDAMTSGFVHARFVGRNHARLQRQWDSRSSVCFAVLRVH